VQRVAHGKDAQCHEAKQHDEDERDARIDLLDAMYEDLLTKFLTDTEVGARACLLNLWCSAFNSLWVLFSFAAIFVEV